MKNVAINVKNDRKDYGKQIFCGKFKKNKIRENF